MKPSLELEYNFNSPIAGVDEAGRGPLSGPVVAAAVILDESALGLGINDSKKLSEKKRENLYEIITSKYQWSIGIIEPEEIDNINILQATMKAMEQAIHSLNGQFKTVLIDGNQSPANDNNFHTIIKGDSKSLSIAAASIIAKVSRDRIMQTLHKQYPQYDWMKNKGYGTKAHLEAIKEHGLSPFHRKTFCKKFQIL